MGRQLSQRYERYQPIPVNQGGAVYVAELETGVVKVGYSRSPRYRLQSLDKSVRRVFGTDVRRYFVRFVGGDRLTAQAEAQVLRRVRRIASPVMLHQEYFHGLKFGAAVTLVRQVCRRVAEQATPEAEQGA